MTAQEAIGYLRRAGEEAETIYYCYVLDADNRLIGVFSLRELVVAPPTRVIDDIMVRDVVSVTPDTSCRHRGPHRALQPARHPRGGQEAPPPRHRHRG